MRIRISEIDSFMSLIQTTFEIEMKQELIGGLLLPIHQHKLPVSIRNVLGKSIRDRKAPIPIIGFMPCPE